MKIKKFRKILALCLIVALVMSCAVVSYNATDDTPTVNTEATPYFASEQGIYGHCDAGSDSKEGWQMWSSYSGRNAMVNTMYLFLPSYSSDKYIELYNNYELEVKANDVTIESKKSAVVPYTDGKAMLVVVGSDEYKLIVSKSDSESSIYVNDITNSYVDCEGNTKDTDFYSFLTENKENYVSGSNIAITSSTGVEETKLKKIKGRGNTNWKNEDKKPFNLTFNSKTTIGNITSKKFSLTSNARDSVMVRNKVLYDLANEIGSPYSPDISYVDLYINGVYRGCYTLTQKVALGKSSLVTLEDTSDTADSDFNFLVEIDVWNYQNDVNFTTTRKFHVVCKSPDLDGYPDDTTMTPKYNYIKSKYQELEDAFYGGTMADLEKICDLDSLATMYLIQELGKNCDGGYTSTYFAYNAEKGKFYAAPVWDFDSTLGAVDCTRDGCSTSTCQYIGWTTKLATYRNRQTPLGRAFNLSGTTSDGKTFLEICQTIWKDRVIPGINILCNGGTSKNGRLKSIDTYVNAIKKAQYNNYVMWDFAWVCSEHPSGLAGQYSSDYDGELQYMKDWLVARANWITSQYGGDPIATESTPVTTKPAETEKYYVMGEGFSGWLNPDSQYLLNNNGDGSYYIDVTFKAGTSYSFKIMDSKGIYYDPDFEDETTSKYVSETGTHGNAGCTPTENINATITLKDGKFTVAVYPQGDVNLDGVVNIDDATMIQKISATLVISTTKQNKLADYNNDGKVNIRDVTSIQKLLAKIN